MMGWQEPMPAVASNRGSSACANDWPLPASSCISHIGGNLIPPQVMQRCDVGFQRCFRSAKHRLQESDRENWEIAVWKGADP